MPGYILSGARHKEDMTQAELAQKTGIPQRHISEMENSKRTIGKSAAKKFAAALDVDYRIFL
jgi:transcriptional regulator with XRE-family HTH domain